KKYLRIVMCTFVLWTNVFFIVFTSILAPLFLRGIHGFGGDAQLDVFLSPLPFEAPFYPYLFLHLYWLPLLREDILYRHFLLWLRYEVESNCLLFLCLHRPQQQ